MAKSRWAHRMLVAAGLIGVPGTDVNAAPIEWPIADGGNGHFYELVTDPLPWPDARTAAAALPGPSGFGTGHLVTIRDAEENEFLRTTFAVFTTYGFYIGFTDEIVEGEWRWIDDTPGIWQDPDNFPSPIQSAYVNWGGVEPNDNPPLGEDYGIFDGGTPGTWNDGEIGPPGLYVVEWQPIPEPSTVILLSIAISVSSACGRRRRNRSSPHARG